MKILLIGKNGQIGKALASKLSSCSDLYAVGSDALRLESNEDIWSTVRSLNPNLIVNAAAYTNVDAAENEESLAFQVNAYCLTSLAAVALDVGAAIIHYSTDYVFDGAQITPYPEAAPTAPLNAYGRSKVAGEKILLKAAVPALIIRTSWIYSPQGQNFLCTMLRLFRERTSLSVVNDQTSAPTSAEAVASMTAQIIRKMDKAPDHYLEQKGGLLHMTCSGRATWFDFANEIRVVAEHKGLSLQIKELLPITSDQYPLPAARPRNSLLSLEKLEREFGIVAPHWKRALVNVFEHF
ncbi:dTDP-4-dehydrorhamnose reductase [bacterium]|nr:dTDP-4-dehydrorhamnose reductase [bacterium]